MMEESIDVTGIPGPNPVIKYEITTDIWYS